MWRVLGTLVLSKPVRYVRFGARFSLPLLVFFLRLANRPQRRGVYFRSKIVILSRYERICVLHVREKFSLTNQMSTVYLYSSSLFVVPTCDSLYRRLASEARSEAE